MSDKPSNSPTKLIHPKAKKVQKPATKNNNLGKNGK